MTVVRYFGCARGIDQQRDVGHGWYMPAAGPRCLTEPSQEARAVLDHLFPRIDGSYAPRNPGRGRGTEAPQGECHVEHADGWTLISFWDRTGDERAASNSNFVVEGEHTLEQALELARQAMPALFERFTFPLIAYDPSAWQRHR
jgi:hypothetical protein